MKEYDHYNYARTLEDIGISGSLSDIDVSKFDAKVIIAMLGLL